MVIRKYIRMNTIDMADFEDDLNKYATFNQFFTRKLRPGSRPQGAGITAPADGVSDRCRSLFRFAALSRKREQLSAGRAAEANPDSTHGSFATIYLSPADYHRVHAPLDGTVTAIRHLHGGVYTVNPTQLHTNTRNSIAPTNGWCWRGSLTPVSFS
jgi:phosphatidylserine decarboxylase